MSEQELKGLKIIAMNYDDPIRGNILALITQVELDRLEIENLKEKIKRLETK